MKLSAVHVPASVRVTVPPNAPPALVIGTVAFTGTSPPMTLRTTADTIRGAAAELASAGPPVSSSTLPPPVMAFSRQVPVIPAIAIVWPTVKPSAIQSPVARVTVPPPAPARQRGGHGLAREHLVRRRGDLGRRQDAAAQAHDGVDHGVGRIVVGEAGHEPRVGREAGDLDGLADEEALGLPVERLRPRELHAHAAVGRDHDGARQLDRLVGIERALDVDVVVAVAEQEVDHLDGALGAVGDELAVDELDRPEADAAGEDRRLAERLRVAAGEGRAEVEVLRRGRARTASSTSSCRCGPAWSRR